MIFPGPVERRIIRESAVIADFCQSPSLLHEVAGFLQPFRRDVAGSSHACFGLEEMHEVIRAHKKGSSQAGNGQVTTQVGFDIGQDASYLLILMAFLDDAELVFLQGSRQMNHELCKQRFLQERAFWPYVGPSSTQAA